ncbi:MAG: 2-hydroxyacid dehydrogenase [Bacteroidetes bacterium]|nr:2-hydroxyacid dehydrogenase [Bacteroidota bacterium]
MKTLVYSARSYDKSFLEKEASGKHELIFTDQHLNVETVELAKGCEAISLFTSDNASAEVLEKLSAIGVKYIALRTAGFDHVDVPKAKTLGIKVARVAAYSPNAIAEHAVAMLMALNRKIVLGQKLMNKEDYRLDELVGFDLKGKTVGIVGTGKIGSAFASIMNGFGCNLLAYDVEVNKELSEKLKIKYVSIDELCVQSDVISLHCPLNEKTKYLFDEKLFFKMKKGVFFINTARGGIVNTNDLRKAIDGKIVAAAGLDVYENEKAIFFSDHADQKITDGLFLELRSYQNVLITGHQSFLTKEALTGIANTTIANIDAWQKGESSPNEL